MAPIFNIELILFMANWIDKFIFTNVYKMVNSSYKRKIGGVLSH